jgi:hypothetical protein
MADVVLALDQGTTSSRAIVSASPTSARQWMSGTARRDAPFITPLPGMTGAWRISALRGKWT